MKLGRSAGGVGVLLLAVGLSAAQQAEWRISSAAVFPAGRPANAAIERLLAELEDPKGQGLALSRQEFEAICDQALPVVYREQLIKYATPRSVEIQNREHADYSRVFMKEKRQQAGVEFLQLHQELLQAAQEKYGVPPHDIVSILMWESGLGEFVGAYRVFNIFLAQLLYLEDGRQEAIQSLKASGDYDPAELQSESRQRSRLERIRKRAVLNLSALLRLSKQKGVDPTLQLGSWGGALGFPQFIPASLTYAADGDGDGNIDLNSWPDAIFSVANYLKRNGYNKSRRKGLYAYNPINSYVDGVILYSDAIRDRYSTGEQP